MRGKLVLSFVVLLSLSTLWSGNLLANSRQEYREAIRSMPLLERPNRFGHFYGNTVRRIYHRRYGYLPGQQAPTANQTLQSAPTPANVQ